MPTQGSSMVELTGKITMICIIFLFLVIVFFMFLRLWFLWGIEEPQPLPTHGRRFHHGRNGFRLVFTTAEESAQVGLDPSILRSLPMVIFEAKDFEDGLDCAVCLCEVEPGEKLRLLPNCNHGFHVDCIDMWFQSHSTCPLCRKPAAASQKIQSPPEEISASFAHSMDSPDFPTNVLFWGDQNQVRSNGHNNCGCSPPPSSSSSSSPHPASQSSSSTSSSYSSSSTDARQEEVSVIDVPAQLSDSIAEEESKSTMQARLKSLKKLLIGEKMVPPSSATSTSTDV